MVVSGSDTSHSAGWATCGARASAGTAPISNGMPRVATTRRRSDFNVKSNLPAFGFARRANDGKLNPHLPLCEASAKAPRTCFAGQTFEPELPGPDPYAPPLLG